ncbi:hypothetical protein NQ315_002044 [Exocentrus adspersus]|uniref:Uncharacterized protein n=1 Tax=Exocentrus adspersus TaxID=1586481 RepID=A0AAV8VFP8_9CUCU|nr:hypothetical protein NQ315_002044 [Exocentrus adspersus]
MDKSINPGLSKVLGWKSRSNKRCLNFDGLTISNSINPTVFVKLFKRLLKETYRIDSTSLIRQLNSRIKEKITEMPFVQWTMQVSNTQRPTIAAIHYK